MRKTAVLLALMAMSMSDVFAATGKIVTTNYVDGAMNAAVTSAVTSANTYTDTEIGKIETGIASDLAGYVKTDDFDTFKTANTSAIGAAKLEAVGTAANDATTKAGKALTDAKAYTDTKVGNLGTSADVVSYVDAKTSGIAKEADLTTLQNTVDGHTTSITNLTNNKLDKSTYNTDKATFETINGAAGKYEPILDAAERAAITSGITAAKVADIATAKQVAENAVNIANAAGVTAGEAKTTAEGAVDTANEAKTAAGQAKTTANGAVTTANAAKSTADTAKSTADAAKTAADTATTNVTNLTTTVNGHTTSIGALESGKLNVVPATSVTTDGQYVLTMKKSGETMTYAWELVTRSEGK
jgi:hypothetical protein